MYPVVAADGRVAYFSAMQYDASWLMVRREGRSRDVEGDTEASMETEMAMGVSFCACCRCVDVVKPLLSPDHYVYVREYR